MKNRARISVFKSLCWLFVAAALLPGHYLQNNMYGYWIDPYHTQVTLADQSSGFLMASATSSTMYAIFSTPAAATKQINFIDFAAPSATPIAVDLTSAISTLDFLPVSTTYDASTPFKAIHWDDVSGSKTPYLLTYTDSNGLLKQAVGTGRQEYTGHSPAGVSVAPFPWISADKQSTNYIFYSDVNGKFCKFDWNSLAVAPLCQAIVSGSPSFIADMANGLHGYFDVPTLAFKKVQKSDLVVQITKTVSSGIVGTTEVPIAIEVLRTPSTKPLLMITKTTYQLYCFNTDSMTNFLELGFKTQMSGTTTTRIIDFSAPFQFFAISYYNLVDFFSNSLGTVARLSFYGSLLMRLADIKSVIQHDTPQIGISFVAAVDGGYTLSRMLYLPNYSPPVTPQPPADPVLTQEEVKLLNDNTTALEMVSSNQSFDLQKKTFTLNFSGPILDLEQMAASLNAYVVDQSGKQIPNGQFRVAGTSKDSSSVTLEQEKKEVLYLNADLVVGLDPVSGSAFRYANKPTVTYSSFPIVIKNISNVDANARDPFGDLFAKAVGPALRVGTIFGTLVSTTVPGMISGAASGSSGKTKVSSILKLVDALQYTLYLNGPYIKESEGFLEPFKENPIEVVPNLFETDETGLDCETVSGFGKEEVSCLILNNVGQEITLLLLVAVACVLMKLLLLGETRWNKIKGVGFVINVLLFFPKRLLRFELFLELLDGSQIDLLLASYVSFRHYSPNKKLNLGLFVAVLIFAVYLAYGWLLWAIGARKRAEFRGGNPKPLGKLAAGLFGAMECLWEDLPSDEVLREKHFLFLMPFFLLLKNFSIHFFLVLLAGRGMNQVKLILIIELIYLYIAIRHPHMKSPWSIFEYRLFSFMMASIQLTVLLSDYLKKHADLSTFGFILVGEYSVLLLVELGKFLVENVALVWLLFKYISHVLRGRPLQEFEVEIGSARADWPGQQCCPQCQCTFALQLNNASSKPHYHQTATTESRQDPPCSSKAFGRLATNGPPQSEENPAALSIDANAQVPEELSQKDQIRDLLSSHRRETRPSKLPNDL